MILVLNYFLEWCQNYESKRCNLWKSSGLCKSRSPRVKNMMRKLCYETCNFCGTLYCAIYVFLANVVVSLKEVRE